MSWYYIVLAGMKRRSDSSHSVKSQESNDSRRQKRFITFDYSNSIKCFISTSERKLHCSLSPSRPAPDIAPPTISPKQAERKQLCLQIPRKNKGIMAASNQQTFNNKILLLEYEREEDSRSEDKPESKERSKGSSKSEEDDQAVNAVVNSCLMVITEDTEPSSNPPSARCPPQNTQANFANQGTEMHTASPNQMIPMMPIMPMYQMMPMHMQMQMQYQLQMQMQMSMQTTQINYDEHYTAREPGPRNRKTVSTEQSAMFIVDPEKAVSDGRTTVMIRNIPNKYTQQMLLSLFRRNHNRKFDFFYLPIDYSNKCNVGYAFINFVHTKFIIDFYEDFHEQRWERFNSDKICQVCYARIQGTVQLQNHFINSNVIQQKDKRFRPLIGVDFFDQTISPGEEVEQSA